jgi:hypothetical protein
MNELERRLHRTESRFAIQDLVVNYATLLDDHRWAQLGELFARQGVFASPNSTTVGRDAIVDNFTTKLAKYSWSLHDPHGHSVEFDDDTHARGTVIGYSELGSAEATLATSIRYLDDYVVEDGRWRFAKRTVLSLYGLTLTDKASGGLSATERKRWPGRPPEVAELPDYDRRHPGYPG